MCELQWFNRISFFTTICFASTVGPLQLSDCQIFLKYDCLFLSSNAKLFCARLECAVAAAKASCLKFTVSYIQSS